jgi:hypothetical protein
MCFPNTPKSDIKTIAFHNRCFSYWIQLSYDGNVNGNRLLNNNSSIQNAFRGPVVALAYNAEEGLSKPALDVDTGTLNPVLEYARLRAEYAGPVFVEQPQEDYEERAWMAFMKSDRGGRDAEAKPSSVFTLQNIAGSVQFLTSPHPLSQRQLRLAISKEG